MEANNNNNNKNLPHLLCFLFDQSTMETPLLWQPPTEDQLNWSEARDASHKAPNLNAMAVCVLVNM